MRSRRWPRPASVSGSTSRTASELSTLRPRSCSCRSPPSPTSSSASGLVSARGTRCTARRTPAGSRAAPCSATATARYAPRTPQELPRRLYVEREIDPEQAAVVKRIFELCAAARGFRRIAVSLNAEAATVAAPAVLGAVQRAGDPAPRPLPRRDHLEPASEAGRLGPEEADAAPGGRVAAPPRPSPADRRRGPLGSGARPVAGRPFGLPDEDQGPDMGAAAQRRDLALPLGRLHGLRELWWRMITRTRGGAGRERWHTYICGSLVLPGRPRVR